MKKILLLILVLCSCSKAENPYDPKEDWFVEANSEISVHFWLTFNGTEKISTNTLSNGKSKIFKKYGELNQDYHALEVECLSQNCSYKVNGETFSTTKVFDKSL